jgi:hypothetical protein
MRIEEMRLDGNAAGGALRVVFAHEVTGAIATCAGCGSAGPVGALLEYGQSMGVILRCPQCDAAMVRIALTPGWVRMDASGLALLAIPQPQEPAIRSTTSFSDTISTPD